MSARWVIFLGTVTALAVAGLAVADYMRLDARLTEESRAAEAAFWEHQAALMRRCGEPRPFDEAYRACSSGVDQKEPDAEASREATARIWPRHRVWWAFVFVAVLALTGASATLVSGKGRSARGAERETELPPRP